MKTETIRQLTSIKIMFAFMFILLVMHFTFMKNMKTLEICQDNPDKVIHQFLRSNIVCSDYLDKYLLEKGE